MKSITDTMHGMVGMGDVGAQANKLIARALNDQQRAEAGLPVKPKTLHMIFAGPPGTGKTTAAHLISELYNSLGLLPSNKVVVAKKDDLIGKYEGQTVSKTRDMVKKAKGGVLFVDEAYALVHGEHDMYGKQAMDVLVEEMDLNRDDTAVIFAGYGPDMKKLVALNPGMESRIPTTIHFKAFTKREQGKIASKFLGLDEYELTPKNRRLVESAAARVGQGNARRVRNLMEKITDAQGARLVQQLHDTGKAPSKTDLRRILAEDIAAGVADFESTASLLDEPRRVGV